MSLEQLQEYLLDLINGIKDNIIRLADRTSYLKNQLRDLQLQVRYIQIIIIGLIVIFIATIIHLHKKNKKIEYEIAKLKEKIKDNGL